MFRQKKSIWKRGWFVVPIIILLGFGYWINQSTNSLVKPNNIKNEAADRKSTEHISNKEDISGSSKAANAKETDQEIDETSEEKPYYLIKEQNHIITIYYYNEKGEKTFRKNADISYLLLSEADQLLFSEGIVKHTEEELEELLQDFGS